MKPKQILIKTGQIGVSAALIWWLVSGALADDPEAFSRLAAGKKSWGSLALGASLCLLAVSTTFVRWFFLVRSLELPFRLIDAFRLGFFGFFWNFLVGTVWGDLIKAFWIAREHPQNRAQAVATVFVDRIIGLYGLFVVATIAIITTGLHDSPVQEIQIICWTAFLSTAGGAVGVLALLIPGLTSGRVSQRLASIPKIGGTIAKLIDAVRMYKSRIHIVGLAGLMSLGVHSLLAMGIHFLARGLPGETPSLAVHFVAIPIGMLTQALPLPLGALGAFEFVVDYLYRNLPISDVETTVGYGLVVCLTYRFVTIGIAGIGAFFYVNVKREIADDIDGTTKSPAAADTSNGQSSTVTG